MDLQDLLQADRSRWESNKNMGKTHLLLNICHKIVRATYEAKLRALYSVYRCAPIFAGNKFQDLPRLRETADNTERYI
jgi:hypothetical protein